jgi:predicted protein tyrosine phosphatase
MSKVRNLLFVCSHNQRRSITAERLFENCSEYEVLSAGTERGARVRVTEEHLQWADIIFVMEQHHIEKLRKKFKPALAGKRVISLQVPDIYGCVSFELFNALKEKVGLYVNLPDSRSK